MHLPPLQPRAPSTPRSRRSCSRRRSRPPRPTARSACGPICSMWVARRMHYSSSMIAAEAAACCCQILVQPVAGRSLLLSPPPPPQGLYSCCFCTWPTSPLLLLKPAPLLAGGEGQAAEGPAEEVLPEGGQADRAAVGCIAAESGRRSPPIIAHCYTSCALHC